MIRRRFIQLAASVSVGGLTALAASERKTVTYRMQGFTCITCAVGLDVLLERQKGVISAHSSYPDARTTIVFHPELVSEAALKAAIEEMGFHAE